MSNPPERHEPLTESLEATRAKMRHDLTRANTVVGFILVVVLALAVAGGIAGLQSARNLKRAEQAEADSVERLWNSYVAQARATRLTAVAGRRENALLVVSNAALIHNSAALRTEAVATLALTDLVRDGEVTPLPGAGDQAEMDAALEHFSYGDTKGNVIVANLSDGSIAATLNAATNGPGFKLLVRSTAFSPDGKLLVTRHVGGALAVWDWRQSDCIFTAGAEATNLLAVGMSFTADSRQLMFSDPERDRQITVLDLETRARLATGIRNGGTAFRFRPGTAQVLVVSNTAVNLMEHPSGKMLHTFDQPTRVFMQTWSPDGALLAVSCEDGDVYLWDVERGTRRVLHGHTEPCIRLGFSPDGKLLFTGSRDGTTRLWDADSGQLILLAEDTVGHVFSPDGERLGFWRLATALGKLKVQRSDCYAALPCPVADGAFLSLDLSVDGRWLMASQTKGVRVWDLAAENRAAFFPVASLASARIAPDGKSFFICRTNGLERWPLTEAAQHGGALAFAETAAIALPDNVGARQISVSADGGTAAVELADSRFITLDLKGSNAPVIFPERWRGPVAKGAGSATGPGRFVISPDGRWIATGYWLGPNDNPRVWDARTAKVIATPHMSTALVTFSPDGQWLGLAGAAEFQIFATTNWTERATKFPRDEKSYTHGALAFFGNGDLAYTRTRQVIQLRQAVGEEKYFDLIAPTPQSVASIRVTPNGSVLATASAGSEIQVWRLERLRERLAALKLDWGTPAPQPVVTMEVKPDFVPPHHQFAPALGFAAFALVALLSLFTLRRHRLAIESFFAAEEKSARRNRELEVAKVELMHSQKMQALGTLATGIAHDFNNLLSVIRMSNKLIGRETKTNADIQENVADIESAVMQGKSVVGSMLGYARTEDVVAGPTDISSVVEETVSLLSKEFLSGIALTLQLNRHAPTISISRGQVEQMLLNLVVNASEAMAGKGNLKISVHPLAALPVKNFTLRPKPAAKFVELAVADSGPGIPEEIRARLFEPFFTTKRSGAKAGTGLGLSLVYSVAQQEQLGLNVESEPGQGAVFSIYFPLKTQ